MDAGRRERADGGPGTTDAPGPTDAATRRGLLAGTAGALATVGTGCLGGLPGAGEPTPSPVESMPAPVLGSADAPATVVAFEDFACPHCRRFALEVLPRLADEYVADGRVRYEHRDFPIPVDPTWSWRAPSAARAVQDAEGAAAFFAFAERLYEHLGSYDAALIADLAEEVGVDGETVRRAATTDRYRPVIEADRRRGLDLGVDGTPAVFVEGERLSGSSFDTVAAAIESRP
jgi:protein-disulfide isomerase